MWGRVVARSCRIGLVWGRIVWSRVPLLPVSMVYSGTGHGRGTSLPPGFGRGLWI
jgi:hypothetical protein